MRTRTTVLLALALACASVLAWIDRSPSPPPTGGDVSDRAPSADGIVRLLNFSSPAVERITLQRGTFQATLTRTDRGWSHVADPDRVDDFLRSMQEMAQIIVVGPDEARPSTYGLDPPVARIILERSADNPIELRIGNSNPPGTGVYAQVGAQGPVVLTGALALWDLDKLVRIIQSTNTPAASDNAGSGRPTP